MTVIEVIVVVAVVGLLVALVLPQFNKLRENQTLKTAAEDVLTALGKARGQTLSSLNSSAYGVHFQSDKVVIFKGQNYSAAAPDNENISLISPATISDISFSGAGSDIYFERLTGAPSAYGSITITSGANTKIITISATGNASAN